MAGKISENRHSRGPHSHLKPPRQRTPPNIRISLTLLETAIPGLHFRRWQYGSICIQIFVVGSERHVCNAIERIIAVQGQFRVSKVIDFGTNRKRIYDLLVVVNSNLGPILQCFGDTAVIGRKIASSYPPVSEIALARGDPYRISWWTRYFYKLECSGSRMVKKSWC